jgi:hypothetical protein
MGSNRCGVAIACAVMSASVAASAQRAPARTPPPRTATAAATDGGSESSAGVRTRTNNATAPGTFQGPQRITAADVGSGQAPSTAAAPTTELRGAAAPSPDEFSGPIGPGDAARLVRARMSQFQPCYDQARATRPTLAGRVELRFTIGPGGRVTQAGASGMPDAPEVATCLTAALRAATFPAPAAGSVQMIYPVMFSPPPAPPGRTRAHPARPPARPATGTTARTTVSSR